MNARRLIPLALVALALLATALWLSSSRRPSQQAEARGPLAEGLTARVNDIETVRIIGAGGETLATLSRSGEGWGVVERDGYAVDTAKLRELLLTLAQARRIEPKTADPERHERLGVEDIKAADASGTLVEIEGGGDPLRLLIGHTDAAGKGSYVRLADDPQSWLTDRAIRVERTAGGWLQRDLADIAVERISRVEVKPETGKPIVIDRADDVANDFRIVDLPAGREPASAFIGESMAGLLSELRFEDVLAASSVTVPETVRTARFDTRDGLVVDVRSWQADGKTHATLQATLDEERANAGIAAEQARARADWDAQQAALAADDAEVAAASGGDDAEPTQSDTADAAAASSDADAGSSGDASKAVDASATSGTPVANDAGAAIAPEAPLAVRDPEVDREQRLQALRSEVEQLNARFADRVFVLPGHKAANLNRDHEAYLKPKA